MLNNGYRLLTIEDIVKLVNDSNLHLDRMIVRKDFAINLDIARTRATTGILNMVMTPFRFNDDRIFRVISGTINMEINLKDYSLTKGDILLVKRDSTFEIKEISQDAAAEAIVFFSELCESNLRFRHEAVIKVRPNKDAQDEISHLIYTIYTFSKPEPFRKDVIFPLVSALINEILSISEEKSNVEYHSQQKVLYNKFIECLSSNQDGKTTVTHYAEKLCVTPQYLSKVISSVSGKTAKYWINRAIITQARILLKDNNKSISEISDLLNFPNDSFFCRFFKRETGLTPTQYRR